MALTSNEIQKAYIAFFNRPADVPGMEYWMTYTGSSLDILNLFAKSEEYLSDYFGLSNEQIVQKVYQNLFGRPVEPEGLTYWAEQMDAGYVTIANAAYEIMGGARNEDATNIKNKVSMASFFTRYLDTPEKVEAYNNAGINGVGNEAKMWLSNVNDTSVSIAAALNMLDKLLDVLVVSNGGEYQYPGDGVDNGDGNGNSDSGDGDSSNNSNGNGSGNGDSSNNNSDSGDGRPPMVSLEEAKAIELELYYGYGGYRNEWDADHPRRDCGFYSLGFAARTGAYLVLQNQDDGWNSADPPPSDGVYFIQKYDLPDSFVQRTNGAYGGIYIWNGTYFIAYPEFGAYTLHYVAPYEAKGTNPHVFNILHDTVFDLTGGDAFVPHMPMAESWNFLKTPIYAEAFMDAHLEVGDVSDTAQLVGYVDHDDGTDTFAVDNITP